MIHPLLIALATVALAGVAFADVVELKTGQRIEGNLKQATPTEVVIEVGGQVIIFSSEKVRAIYFGVAPSQNPEQSSARQEALRALKALKSVTEAGVSYRDYAPRVSDAKIIVDRYLQGSDSEPAPVKIAIGRAMQFYVLAANAWNVRIVRDAMPNALGLDPVVMECEHAKRVVEQRLEPRWQQTDRTLGSGYSAGAAIAFYGVSALWTCAAERITQADALGQ